MELYTISNQKSFMAKLLKEELFDRFEVREVILHTSFKVALDGTRNVAFYDSSEEASTLSTYLTWQELRTQVYSLMQGSKLPIYFKIVLSTNASKTAAISDQISTCFLNIQFKDHELTCSTAIAYKTFSLDKSPEALWDQKMQQFLLNYDFI